MSDIFDEIKPEKGDVFDEVAKKKPTEIRKGVAPWRRTASKIYTPVLEGLGFAGGALLGSAAATPVVGGVAGAGLGYATGRTAATLLDEGLGIGHDKPQPQNLREASYETVKNVLTGAEMEMGGQVIGKVAGAVGNKLAQFGREGTPLSNKLAQTRAAEMYTDAAAPTGTITAPIQRQTQAATDRLNRRITRGLPQGERARFTAGQRTGNPKLGGMEKSQMNTDPAFRDAVEYSDDALLRAARGQTEKAIPGERGGVTIRDKVQRFAANLENQVQGAEGAAAAQAAPYATPAPPQELGERIITTVQKAREPFTEATRKAYAEVPDYPMQAETFEGSLKKALDTPGMKDTENILADFAQYAEREPRTTQGLQAIDQTLTKYLRKKDLDPQAAHHLEEIQSALRKDFDLMGDAAEAGDVALHEGNLVIPSKVKAEISKLEGQLEKLSTAPLSLKEENAHLQKYLASKGETVMQNTGITDEQFAKSLQDRLAYLEKKGVTGYEAPKGGVPDPKKIEGVQQAIAQRHTILNNLQPAEDVAAKYTAARKTAKEEFDRFTRGTLEDVFKQGKEASGMKLTSEAVPRRFTTPSGADDLIRAAGKDEAKALMRDHYAAEANALLGKNPKQLAAWAQKNKPVLQKYGLYDEFKSLHAAQKTVVEARATLDQFNKSAVAKILGAEPEKAISYVLGAKNPEAAMKELLTFDKSPEWRNGLKVALREHILDASEVTARDTFGANKASLAKVDKLGAQYDRTMKVLYSPKEIQAIKDFTQTVEVLGRNKRAVPGGGSDTAANLLGNIQARIAYGAARDVAKHLAGGITNGLANLGSAVAKLVGKEHADLTAQFVKEALLDPRKAKLLTQIAKGNRAATLQQELMSEMRGFSRATKARAAAVAAFGDKGGGAPEEREELDTEPRKEYGEPE